MKTLILFLLSTLLSFAQENNVSLRLMAFPRSADDSPVQLNLGERTIDVQLAANCLSDPYTVPAMEAWDFGQRTTDGEGKSTFESWGRGKARSAKRQIVILLRKGPKNADGFRVLTLNDGPKHFDERQLLFYNLSLEDIAGEVGGVKFALKPAQHKVITPKADQGKDLCHASLLLMKNDKWRPFMESNWPLKKDTRGLIFLYTDPATSKVRLHTIRDFL